MRFILFLLSLSFSVMAFGNQLYFFCETRSGTLPFDNVGFQGYIAETKEITESYFVPTNGYGWEVPIFLEQSSTDNPNYLWQAMGHLADGTRIQISVENHQRRTKAATFIFSSAETDETRLGFCVVNPVRL
jgi:hypothetical protein